MQPDVLFEAVLVFTGKDGSPSASPLVQVEVADQTVLMILDNAAGYQTFSSAFALRHDLPVKGRIIGHTDHSGASLSGLRLHPFPLHLGSATFSLERAAAFDLPSDFEAQGIVGLFSPTSLLDSGYVVLDVPAGHMYGINADSAVANHRLQMLGYAPLRIETEVDAGGDLYVPVSLDGRDYVWAAIDLGAPYSYFTAAYSGRPTSDECQTVGISGGCVRGAVSQGHRITLAGSEHPDRTIRVMERISGGEGAGFRVDGLLGMDILRMCALALPKNPADPLYLACRQVPDSQPQDGQYAEPKDSLTAG